MRILLMRSIRFLMVMITGDVHGSPQARAKGIHVLAVRALRLCTSLHSFSWVDNGYIPDEHLLTILDALKSLPLHELTIRTFKNLGSPVWDALHQFRSLTVSVFYTLRSQTVQMCYQSVSIFCMEGPPRILQGWSEIPAPTLTHLDLGVGV